MHKSKAPSLFAAELDMAIERWAGHLPQALQGAFRADLRRFAGLHDGALDAIEGIWERRERASAFDESTGVATRRPFLDHLTTLLRAEPSSGLAAVGVLFIDLDRLKRINDSCGHAVGDRALAAIGAIVREALRVDPAVDVVSRSTDDVYGVARHGGDEFVVALRLAESDEIDRVATRIKRRADDPDRQRARGYNGPFSLSVSVGGVVYELPETAPSVAPNAIARALLAAADSLMYQSKRDGWVHLARARFTDKLEVHGDRRIPAIESVAATAPPLTGTQG
jgi:diguanylate cyclase (GGDEF)-like protein